MRYGNYNFDERMRVTKNEGRKLQRGDSIRFGSLNKMRSIEYLRWRQRGLELSTQSSLVFYFLTR